MTVKCDCCGKFMDEPGALIFAPPKSHSCMKYHACVECWPILFDYINLMFAEQIAFLEVTSKKLHES